MKTWLIISTLATAGVVLIQPAVAATLSDPWFTVDGGGTSSGAGSFKLTGTIGQWDGTAPATGGAFTLAPGFWPALTDVQPPESPALKIRFIGNGQAILSWPLWITGFRLEELSELGTNHWTAASESIVDTGGEHTVTVPTTGTSKCYRLRK